MLGKESFDAVEKIDLSLVVGGKIDEDSDAAGRSGELFSFAALASNRGGGVDIRRSMARAPERS